MPIFPSIYQNICFNGDNLVSYLAKGKHVDEVNTLLLSREYQKEHAIYGYAYGGNEEEVTLLLKQNANLVSFASAGYARGGFITEVQALITTYPEQLEAIKIQSVYGYGQAGDTAQINAALRSSSNYVLPTLLGYASTNQHQLLKQLLKGTVYYPQAVKEAAKNGHFALVQELFKDLNLDTENPGSIKTASEIKFLNTALTGYIQGRHFKHANMLMQIGANPICALQALSDTKGKMDKDDLVALLTYIDNQSLREQVLSLIVKTDFNLKSTEFDMQVIKQNNEALNEGCNYLEICTSSYPDSPLSQSLISGEITIPMLSNIVLQAMQLQGYVTGMK